jgi:hypothetical protein
MSIEQNWKQLGERQDEDLSSLLQVSDLSKLPFRHPLEKIRDRMRLGMIVLSVLITPFIVIMILYPVWPLELAIGVMVAYIAAGLYSCWRLYRGIGNTLLGHRSPGAPRSLLDELKQHHHTLVSQQRMSRRLGLVLWPVSILAGLLFGRQLGSDEPLIVFIQRRSTLIEWAVGAVVLVPVFFFLSKSMTKAIYEQDLAVIQHNIRELEGEG